MIFESKSYHHYFPEERFRAFTVSYNQSVLWIGTDPSSFSPEMQEFARAGLQAVYEELESYIVADPFFKKSLKPCPVKDLASEMIKKAAEAAAVAGVGPMAAVPGMICELVARSLIGQFSVEELVVEDVNNLFLKLQDSLNVCIFAGESPLSGMAGIEINAEQTPVGICSSAETAGSLLNYGKADVVMVASANAALAGALATGYSNLIKKPDDVQKVLRRAEALPEITGAVLICEDQVGLHGSFELKLLKGDR